MADTAQLLPSQTSGVGHIRTPMMQDWLWSWLQCLHCLLDLMSFYMASSKTCNQPTTPETERLWLTPAGFKDLHNFAFLGPSGRIGTAQDGIYAYVPAGPHKQFDMFLHSYACYKRGLLQVLPSPSHHNPVDAHSHLLRSFPELLRKDEEKIIFNCGPAVCPGSYTHSLGRLCRCPSSLSQASCMRNLCPERRLLDVSKQD